MSDSNWVIIAEAPNRTIGLSWGELLTQQQIPWRFPARNVAEIFGNDFIPVSIAVPAEALDAALDALGPLANLAPVEGEIGEVPMDADAGDD